MDLKAYGRLYKIFSSFYYLSLYQVERLMLITPNNFNSEILYHIIMYMQGGSVNKFLVLGEL